MYCIFFIHSFIYGYLGCFHLLAMISNIVTICMPISVQDIFLKNYFGYIWKLYYWVIIFQLWGIFIISQWLLHSLYFYYHCSSFQSSVSLAMFIVLCTIQNDGYPNECEILLHYFLIFISWMINDSIIFNTPIIICI